MAKEETTELANKVEPGSLAQVNFGEYADGGFENQTSEDMAIPFLGLLQQLSPQVTKGNDEFIEGAEAGMLFNTVTQELMGEQAFFVPCTTGHEFVEWVPRDKGGGLVARHAVDSEVVATARNNSTSFNDLKSAEGNDIVETFYIYGLLLDEANGQEMVMPITIGFTSTKIKVYKRLMTKLRTIKGKPPLFAFRLGINSKPETNKANQPYMNFEIDYANGEMENSINLPGSEFAGLLEAGQELAKLVSSGQLQAAVESQGNGGSQPAGDDDTPF